MYLYKTNLYKKPNEVAGLTDEEKTQMVLDEQDFTNTQKATATEVDEVVISETTFVISKDYNWFKTKGFTDVKYTEGDDEYQLAILTATEL